MSEHQSDYSGDSNLLDQVVLAAAGLTNQALHVARATASGVVQMADAVAVGALDTAEHWSTFVGPVGQLAAPPIAAGRKVWAVGFQTANTVLAAA